jgi:hypothetical protein
LVNSTWQQRIEKERKHAGDQYQALQKMFFAEVDVRKETEAMLDELKPSSRKGTKNQQKKPVPSYGIQSQDLPARPKSPLRADELPLPTNRVPLPTTYRVPMPLRSSIPRGPVRKTSYRVRDDTRDGDRTAASTIESADGGWSNPGDLPNRNAEYGSKSGHSDNPPPHSPLIVQPYEPGTGEFKGKQGSWAQVVGKGVQKGKMKETESR